MTAREVDRTLFPIHMRYLRQPCEWHSKCILPVRPSHQEQVGRTLKSRRSLESHERNPFCAEK